MFLTHLPLLHVFSFSGMKVKTDTTTQSSYSLLFLSAIVWTEDKKCANIQLQLAPDPSDPHTSTSTPTPGRGTQLCHCPTPVCIGTPGTAELLSVHKAKGCQRSGHSLAKKSQSNSGQTALKRLTGKKTVLIKHEVI